MTEPSHAEPEIRSAPDAVGDIVPGHPPVPITVWQVPAAPAGDTMSAELAHRLITNLTHPHTLILDLSVGSQVRRAAQAARLRHRRHRSGDLAIGRGRAALIVAGWPLHGANAEAFMAGCAARLARGGSTALVLSGGDLTVNQRMIAAARTARLAYLQHVIAAHDLSGRVGRLGADQVHLPAHADVLIFWQPVGRPGDADD